MARLGDGTGEAKYSGRYGRDSLRRAADRDVCAYFNNDVDGHAVTNARELLGYFTHIGQRSARTPGAVA